VRRAFARADRGEPTVLAFTNHDFRDMRPDVADVHALVERVAVDYPEVAWRNAGALQAARAATERGRVLGGGQAREEPAAARTATGRIAAAAGAVAAGGAGSAGSAGSAGAAVAHGAGAEAGEPLRIDVRVHASGGALHLEAVANRPIFGPQPLLAVKTHSQQYLVDNLDIQEPFLRWSYVFDEQSFRPASLEAIALAAADARGNTAVTRLRGDGTPLP